MTMRRTRPMDRNLPSQNLGIPMEKPSQSPIDRGKGGIGGSLSQLFPSASEFLHSTIYSARIGLRLQADGNFPSSTRKHALTYFSILSNIRPVSWGVQWNAKD